MKVLKSPSNRNVSKSGNKRLPKHNIRGSSGKASKVRELASAFKRKKALQSAQSKKTRGKVRPNGKNSSGSEEKHSCTPNRVSAEFMNDLERRLSLSSKKTSLPSEKEELRAPPGNRKSDEIKNHLSKLPAVPTEHKDDQKTSELAVLTPRKTCSGCKGVFIPIWCLFVVGLSAATAAGYSFWSDHKVTPAFVELGSYRSSGGTSTRAGSLQHGGNDISDGSSKALHLMPQRRSLSQ